MAELKVNNNVKECFLPTLANMRWMEWLRFLLETTRAGARPDPHRARGKGKSAHFACRVLASSVNRDIKRSIQSERQTLRIFKGEDDDEIAAEYSDQILFNTSTYHPTDAHYASLAYGEIHPKTKAIGKG